MVNSLWRGLLLILLLAELITMLLIQKTSKLVFSPKVISNKPRNKQISPSRLAGANVWAKPRLLP